MDLTDTIIPKSDQLNADDLISGPRTVTITEVRRGTDEQPVNIHLAEFPGRPFRPSKTVLRILVAAWDKESDVYVGRRLTLYRDPEVRFGGQDVGGIRVSHMSHIAKPLKLALTATRGKKTSYAVQPLKDDAPAPAPDYVAEAQTATTAAEVKAIWARADRAGHLTDALKGQLTAIGKVLAKTAEPPTAPPEPVGDPDDLWLAIVGKTPQGWTTAQLENDFTEFTGGVAPADAVPADMAKYLEQLKAGAR